MNGEPEKYITKYAPLAKGQTGSFVFNRSHDQFILLYSVPTANIDHLVTEWIMTMEMNDGYIWTIQFVYLYVFIYICIIGFGIKFEYSVYNLLTI